MHSYHNNYDSCAGSIPPPAMRAPTWSIGALLCFHAAAELRAAASSTFYVSPTGSDAAGDGSVAHPWASWSHAAVALRPLLPSMTSDLTVRFEPGTYALSRAVMLTPADSGRNGFDVVYVSSTGNASDVLFDGGLPIRQWAPAPGLPGVFSAPLPCATREVYVDGARVQEAPMVGVNLTHAETNVTAWGYVTTVEALIAAASMRSVAASDVELLYTSAAAQWQESRARVASWHVIAATGSEPAALNITMAQPGWGLIRGKAYAETLPTAILNVLTPTALRAGQGLISPARGVIFYAPHGDSMVGVDAWAAAVDGELVLLAGIAGVAGGPPPQPVAHVRIEHVSLRGATWMAPTVEGSYAPDQGGIIYRASDLPGPLGGHALHPVPAALTLRTAAHVALTGVAIAHTGGSAIAVEGGSQDVTISRARVADAGCSAVRLGQVDDADAVDAALFNTRLSVEDSTFDALAQGYRDCSGIFGGFVSHTNVTHNALTNANWAGLTLGWGGWGGCSYRPNLGGNRVVGNRIENVNLIVGDGGPIYTMAQQPSSATCGSSDLSCRSEVAFNYVAMAIHHASMLYHDEGSSHFYTHDNVVLQPLLTDPHKWWWCWAAAWADTEHDITVADNFAAGVNRSDVAAGGRNLVFANNTLLPWAAPWPPAAQRIVDDSGPRAAV